MSRKLAYATLVTSDSYVPAAATLAHELRRHKNNNIIIDNNNNKNNSIDFVLLYTNAISPSTLDSLRISSAFTRLVQVTEICSRDLNNLALLGRPDLRLSLTKLHVWTLTDYSRVVFLDADTLPLTNVDELFDREELSAAPDCGWPDIFNSGVFVLSPSQETFDKLLEFAATKGSWDGGDQGLLNSFFPDWRRIPFTYNVTPTAIYTYAPAFAHFQADIKIVHFAGTPKPWTVRGGAENTNSLAATRGETFAHLAAKWWASFNTLPTQLRDVSLSLLGAHYMRSDCAQNGGNANATCNSNYNQGNSSSAHGIPGNAFGGAFGASHEGGILELLSSKNSIRYSWPEHEFDPNLARTLKVLDSAYHGRPAKSIMVHSGSHSNSTSTSKVNRATEVEINTAKNAAVAHADKSSNSEIGAIKFTDSKGSINSAITPSRDFSTKFLPKQQIVVAESNSVAQSVLSASLSNSPQTNTSAAPAARVVTAAPTVPVPQHQQVPASTIASKIPKVGVSVRDRAAMFNAVAADNATGNGGSSDTTNKRPPVKPRG